MSGFTALVLPSVRSWTGFAEIAIHLRVERWTLGEMASEALALQRLSVER